MTRPIGLAWIARVAFIISVAATLSLAPAAPAHAYECSLSGTTLTVWLWEDEHVSIARTGSNILITGGNGYSSTCGATMTTVDHVKINGHPWGSERAIIDLSGGRFEPGATPETSGTSEIEFDVDLRGCSYCWPGDDDALELVGGTEADIVRFAGGSIQAPSGTPGADLNNDSDLDVFVHDGTHDLRTTLDGRGGNDTLRGGIPGRLPYPRRLTVLGGDGNDSLSGGSSDDLLVGEAGNDSLSGGGGDDRIDESYGMDSANGGTGNDFFNEEAAAIGTTTFIGGDGTDTVSYGARSDGNVSLSLTVDGIANDGATGEGDNIGTDVENLIGGAGDDTLVGGDIDNVLSGNEGDDELVGGLGADVIAGEAGVDLIDYSARTQAVSVFEDGIANDGATGEGDNVIDVEAFKGGSGNDVLSGDGGPDALMGGGGNDTADYSARTDDLAVTADGVADDGVTGEGDNVDVDIENIYGGSGDDDLVGNDRSNRLYGSTGEDDLTGGNGNDHIYGGKGDDREFGNAGNDVFHQDAAGDGADTFTGGLGRDAIDYGERKRSVAVTLNGIPDDGDSVENDNVAIDIENVYGGAGADLLTGNSAANRLIGRGGADNLKGQAGGDTIRAGSGDDSLNGGSGTDACFDGAGRDRLAFCE